MLFDHHGRTWDVSLSCHLLSFFVPFHSFARAKQNLGLWVGYESGAWGVEDVQQEGDAKGEWRLDLRWWPRVSLSWVPLLVSDEHPGSHGCSAEGDGVGVGWIVATKHGHAAENTPMKLSMQHLYVPKWCFIFSSCARQDVGRQLNWQDAIYSRFLCQTRISWRWTSTTRLVGGSGWWFHMVLEFLTRILKWGCQIISLTSLGRFVLRV